MKLFTEFIVYINNKFITKSKLITIDFEINKNSNVEDIKKHLLDVTLYNDTTIKFNNEILYIKPVKIYIDPFKSLPNLLILCVLKSNTIRSKVFHLLNKLNNNILISFEQEFYIMEINKNNPYTINNCPVGSVNKNVNYFDKDLNILYGRNIVNNVCKLILELDIKLHSIIPNNIPCKWKIILKSSNKIDICDDIIILRYILNRVAEIYKKQICFDPKPIKNWKGIGCFVNLSNDFIKKLIEQKNFEKIINELKLLETKNFIFGKGSYCRIKELNESICINSNKLYITDKRLSANVNPHFYLSQLLVLNIINT